MKQIGLFSFLSTLLFLSCAGNEQSGSNSENKEIDSTNNITELPCQYDINNDISDSLKIFIDQVIELNENYDTARFRKRLESWNGKSFVWKEGIVSDVNLSVEEDRRPSIQVDIDSTDIRNPLIDIPKIFTVSLILEFEENSEVKQFTVGDKVKVKGVIQGGLGIWILYYVLLECHEVELIE
ncbi:MAG: hypothetical protein WDZ35_00915 [Crocinitomicaceae bacterium]